jgi:hypothetical protein
LKEVSINTAISRAPFAATALAFAAQASAQVTDARVGKQHQIQMASAPGRTVSVNGAGEPRV